MTGMVRENVASWVSEVRLTPRGVKVRKTGHPLPLGWGALVDARRWLVFYRALRDAAPSSADGPSFYFGPQTARPWYFARAIVAAHGGRVVADPAEADIVWTFDDQTVSPTVEGRTGQTVINGACTDVSKSLVARVSGDCFGVSLTIDPAQHAGPMVAKTEVNGAHDGRIIDGPVTADPRLVYQRLIDNRIDDDRVEDLRTTIMGGEPVLVFKKRRPVSGRFANNNSEVELASLSDVYTEEEVAQIGNVAKALNLDAGGLDVLRDRQTGHLFVVDANKTDMGPPLALPLADKLTATTLMAEALAGYLAAMGATAPLSSHRTNDT